MKRGAKLLPALQACKLVESVGLHPLYVKPVRAACGPRWSTTDCWRFAKVACAGTWQVVIRVAAADMSSSLRRVTGTSSILHGSV